MNGKARIVAVVAAVGAIIVVWVGSAAATHCTGCIDRGDIRADAVAASEIVNGSVGKPEIGFEAVGESEIVDGSILPNDLDQDAVSFFQGGEKGPVEIPSKTSTIATLDLDENTTYMLLGLVDLQNNDETGQTVNCSLVGGPLSEFPTLDTATAHLAPAGDPGDYQTLTFMSYYSGGGNAVIRCSVLSGLGDVDGLDVRILAMSPNQFLSFGSLS